MGTPMTGQFRWTPLGGGAWGADLVSDGETLYRVGGDFQCHSIYRYDGPSPNSWSLVTDQNPQCYLHRSPGENNRSWYYEGKIIVAGHNAGENKNNVTIYDLGSDEWTARDLPVFEHFSWGQAGALDASTSKLYISWTEEGTSHPYATAPLDIATGTWEPTYDRESKIGRGTVVLEDNSGRFVFDLVRGDRYVNLDVYDFQLPTLLPTPDFTGPWLPSSTLDLGADELFMHADRNFGSDVMAWDPVDERLYLVATEKGTTLVYDPIEDNWQQLESRPEGQAYRDGHVAIAHGRLYSQTGDQLWYLPLR
jgi:hypothetical protein